MSRDGRGRALDNVFVERLWRSVKDEDIYIKYYECFRARVGPSGLLPVLGRGASPSVTRLQDPRRCPSGRNVRGLRGEKP